MKYLIECDSPVIGSDGTVNACFVSCDKFSDAEWAKTYMEQTTGIKWSIWRVEYHFEGAADGDKS